MEGPAAFPPTGLCARKLVILHAIRFGRGRFIDVCLRSTSKKETEKATTAVQTPIGFGVADGGGL